MISLEKEKETREFSARLKTASSHLSTKAGEQLKNAMNTFVEALTSKNPDVRSRASELLLNKLSNPADSLVSDYARQILQRVLKTGNMDGIEEVSNISHVGVNNLLREAIELDAIHATAAPLRR